MVTRRQVIYLFILYVGEAKWKEEGERDGESRGENAKKTHTNTEGRSEPRRF